MKYPISLNEKDIKDLQELGQLMGIENVLNVYGGIPKVIKFSISLAKLSIKQTAKDIPTLEPSILQTFLSMIERKKTLEYHKMRKKAREKKRIGITRDS